MDDLHGLDGPAQIDDLADVVRGTRITLARGARTSYGRLIASRTHDAHGAAGRHLLVHMDGDEQMPVLGEKCRVEFGSERGLGTFDGRVREIVGPMIAVAPEGEVAFTQRRSAVRAAVDVAAELRSPKGQIEGVLVDLSLTGARLRCAGGSQSSDTVLAEIARAGRADLHLTLGDGPIALPVVVVGLFPVEVRGTGAGADVRMQWRDQLSTREEARLARLVNAALRAARDGTADPAATPDPAGARALG